MTIGDRSEINDFSPDRARARVRVNRPESNGRDRSCCRVARRRPRECRSAVPTSSSAKTAATASSSLGCATAAWTAPTSRTRRLTGATTPRAARTSSGAGTTRAYPGSSTVPARPTAPTGATRKTAVSAR